MKRWSILVMLLLPLTASAAIDVYEFDTAQQEFRFRQLTEQLRCPKCQNQSISDSDADISREMRERVAHMIRNGRTDEQIITFFTSRYGEFVNYDPPLRAETVVLWAAPGVIIVLGLVVIAFQVRRARRLVQSEKEDDLS